MSYTEQFETFWKLYPGRTNKLGRIRKQDKLGAFEKWCKLTDEERKLAMVGHPVQDKWTPDARKWLKYKRWEDEDVTGKTIGAHKAAMQRKNREKEREQWAPWLKEQSIEKLKQVMQTNPYITWLVRELRPEVFENADTAKGERRKD